ncbi:MAG: DUF692 domain-containing protein [Alphaproteobacteria bacterium]|nr:DUF692 domain-containing protein [Alphaproteobacteria bacterium]MCW5744231.1 DUF692 domain-containing protein [Alphaproteobacteria bacterium]
MLDGAGSPLPSGIGLRAPHLEELPTRRPAVGFLEIHAENYLGGGPAPRRIERLRADYRFSVHAVGLSLGSAEGLDTTHLARVQGLIDRLQPDLVSDHLSWSVASGTYLNDLLPLPYTEESLDVVCRNVGRLQEALGRRVLVENPSSYLRFSHSTIGEAEFLAAVVARTGCGLLCDVNNIHVTCSNMRLDALAYVAALPAEAIGEIHLAGHAVNEADGETILIDDHGSRVAEPVWALLRQTLARIGDRPTLIEWDTDVPALDVLLDEAARADRERRAIGLEAAA